MTGFIVRLLYCLMLLKPGVPAKTNKALHPLHVSTSDISYNNKEGKLEVICTIFVDDFESAIEKQYKVKTDLVNPAKHDVMDVLVKKYLDANLHIKTGSIAAPLTYVGFENNREVVNVYLESDKITQPKKVDVDVSLLHNLYDDQLNIVHITVNGVRKSAKIEFPNKVVIQNF